MVDRHCASRTDLIADSALTLLSERGMRGLTHRAVDETAGLPPGSTSNYARTRAALLETTVARLVALESAVLNDLWADGLPRSREVTADILAAMLHRLITTDRAHTVARFELSLETIRRPALRVAYDEVAQSFLDPLASLLSTLGSREPQRHARSLLSWMEGTVFTSVAGGWSAQQPSEEMLRHGLGELLDGMLHAGPAGVPGGRGEAESGPPAEKKRFAEPGTGPAPCVHED